jgi:hypothetical protein
VNTSISTIECVFTHRDQCDHTGLTCNTPCKSRMQRIDGLTYRDHFEIYERRKSFRYDARLRRATLILSIAAFALSVANLIWTMFKP